MHRQAVFLALVMGLALLLAYGSQSPAAPLQTQIANLKFSGTLSAADQKYLGLEKPGPFTLQDIKAPYILLEIMRTT